MPRPPYRARLAVRNWRVPVRLNAILLLPVAVALVFGGLRVQSAVDTWREAAEAERTAQLVRAAAAYGHALIDERDISAEPLLTGQPDSPAVTEARALTDAAGDEFDLRVKDMPDDERLKRRLEAFHQVEPKLKPLREVAFTDRLSAVESEEGYVEVQHPLMELANELGLGTGNITSYGRTVYAISLTKAAVSLQRSIGMHLLVKPATDREERALQLTALGSYRYLENVARAEYESGGTPEDIQRLKTVLDDARARTEKRVTTAEAEAQAAGRDFTAPPSLEVMIGLISSGADPATLAERGITSRTWFAAATDKFDAHRQVEKELTDAAVQEAKRIADDAKQEAIVNAVVVLAALVIAFVIAGLMARTMSRSMRRLRNAAFHVAEQQLPAMVDQLSRTTPGRVDTRVAPIPIGSRDEIGEVARAFDQVHREAVRLAAEQALLRGNVNAIFTNLSQRNQGLIERQLELVSELENNEADPDQLENLFRMDHLATRMRRNGENLLVLAGEEPGQRWNLPVPLVDVLRAAASEVENYPRIELADVPETEIHGNAVTDLVHLLAELLENATSFSSPQSKVTVRGTRLGDGRVMTEIHDRGIGLTPEDFADINHKLANPPTVDAAISQRMGLYVVGRLAARHGIRVQLRPSGERAGTTSLVMLPEAITHGGGGEERPDEDFTVSRIVPEQPAALRHATGGARSAAELGFDDTRYERRPTTSTLDPVGRSLRRGERRAALDAQQQAAGGDARPRQPTEYQETREYQESTGYPGGHGEGTSHRDPEPAAELAAEQMPGRAPGQPQPAAYRGEAPEAAHAPPQQPVYGAQQAFTPAQSGNESDNPYNPGFPVEAESGGSGAPAAHAERVGFDRPGPAPAAHHSTTGAGLPRRERQWQPSGAASETEQRPHGERFEQPHTTRQQGDSPWGSRNETHRQRAEQLRNPTVGGVTDSGLPRRVPRANLVAGAAAQNPAGGPVVSRAPEDIRGRLSNLHRGVRQGRAGERGGARNDRPGFGPSSTYDQER